MSCNLWPFSQQTFISFIDIFDVEYFIVDMLLMFSKISFLFVLFTMFHPIVQYILSTSTFLLINVQNVGLVSL